MGISSITVDGTKLKGSIRLVGNVVKTDDHLQIFDPLVDHRQQYYITKAKQGLAPYITSINGNKSRDISLLGDRCISVITVRQLIQTGALDISSYKDEEGEIRTDYKQLLENNFIKELHKNRTDITKILDYPPEKSDLADFLTTLKSCVNHNIIYIFDGCSHCKYDCYQQVQLYKKIRDMQLLLIALKDCQLYTMQTCASLRTKLIKEASIATQPLPPCEFNSKTADFDKLFEKYNLVGLQLLYQYKSLVALWNYLVKKRSTKIKITQAYQDYSGFDIITQAAWQPCIAGLSSQAPAKQQASGQAQTTDQQQVTDQTQTTDKKQTYKYTVKLYVQVYAQVYKKQIQSQVYVEDIEFQPLPEIKCTCKKQSQVQGQQATEVTEKKQGGHFRLYAQCNSGATLAKFGSFSVAQKTLIVPQLEAYTDVQQLKTGAVIKTYRQTTSRLSTARSIITFGFTQRPNYLVTTGSIKIIPVFDPKINNESLDDNITNTASTTDTVNLIKDELEWDDWHTLRNKNTVIQYQGETDYNIWTIRYAWLSSDDVQPLTNLAETISKAEIGEWLTDVKMPTDQNNNPIKLNVNLQTYKASYTKYDYTGLQEAICCTKQPGSDEPTQPGDGQFDDTGK